MPVNNDTLKSTIDLMYAEISELNTKLTKVTDLKTSMENILITKVREPNNTGGFDMNDSEPHDFQMNEKMTTIRRQAIYDKNDTLWKAYKAE